MQRKKVIKCIRVASTTGQEACQDAFEGSKVRFACASVGGRRTATRFGV